MRVIMFKDQILSGSKTHTIRKSARCKPGDILSLRRWTQKPYRSKHETLANRPCSAVLTIYINFDKVILDTRMLDITEMNDLSSSDGFKSFKEMTDFFMKTHGLPLSGFLIEWSNNQGVNP